MRILAIILLLAAATVSSDSVSQTDWTGGPGTPGPVTDWGNSFHVGAGADYGSVPGVVSISWGKLTDSGREVPGSLLYGIGAYPGDVDLDGDLDILATSSVDDRTLWWENLDGSASSWSSHVIDPDLDGAWGVICADIDQDGDNDVFGSAMGAGVVMWWENTDGSGLSWTSHSIDDSLAGAKAICLIDLDGDSLPDVAAAAKTADIVAWYRNPGAGSDWEMTVIASDYDGANSVYPADIDGDGDTDMVAAAKSDKAIRWFENTDGFGAAWTEHSITENLDYARTAEAADFDGDGDLDVVCTGGMSKASGRVCWWENSDGSGTAWTEHSINDDFQGPYTVLQYDMDQDGDPDILAGSLTFNAIYWWENTAQGAVWNEHILANYFAPRTVSVADLDGDGAPEAFGGSLYSFDISIWEIMGFGEGTIFSSILDTGGDSQWTELAWNASLPAETSVGFSLRSSWDETVMGEWSDTVWTSPVDPTILIGDDDRFIQYALVLQSDDPEVSPTLEDITLSWNPLGLEEETTTPTFDLASANPVQGTLSVSLLLPPGSSGEFALLDLSGRMIFRKKALHGTGEYLVLTIPDLQPGIYFARMEHAGGAVTGRVTVIR